jgi:hypothetical protein
MSSQASNRRRFQPPARYPEDEFPPTLPVSVPDTRSIVVGDEEMEEEEGLISDTVVRYFGGAQGIPITCNGAPITHDSVAIRINADKNCRHFD